RKRSRERQRALQLAHLDARDVGRREFQGHLGIGLGLVLLGLAHTQSDERARDDEDARDDENRLQETTPIVGQHWVAFESDAYVPLDAAPGRAGFASITRKGGKLYAAPIAAPVTECDRPPGQERDSRRPPAGERRPQHRGRRGGLRNRLAEEGQGLA